MIGGPRLDALKEALKGEALDVEGREAVAREEEEPWDEGEAYMLIRRALAYLCERRLDAGQLPARLALAAARLAPDEAEGDRVGKTAPR